MNCSEVHERLLEADLSELRGDVDSQVSRHVRECNRCRTLANHILEEERALASALAAVPPRVAADQATPVAGRIVRQRRRRRAWATLVPTLAAAGIAGILLVRNGGSPQGSPGAAIRIAERVLPTPSVKAPPGRDVVVFNSDDPNIVIVWFFEGEE